MIPGPIENIDRGALQALIDQEVPEGKTIEYKVDFPGKAQSERVPLLATIASLANTAGGDLLMGVEEKNGIPVGLPGIAIDNLDAVKLQLENMLRNGLAPRLPVVRIHPRWRRPGADTYWLFASRRAGLRRIEWSRTTSSTGDIP